MRVAGAEARQIKARKAQNTGAVEAKRGAT
jgi:hypothetical protein